MLKTVLAVAQALFVAMFGLHAAPALSQDIGPGVTKIKEGIFVYTAKDQESNVDAAWRALGK